jgi:hypothetical protein
VENKSRQIRILKRSIQQELLYWITESVRCSDLIRLHRICSEVERCCKLNKRAIDIMREDGLLKEDSCVCQHKSNLLQNAITRLFNGV